MPQDVMRKENDDSPAGLLIGRVLPGHREAFAIEEIPDENGLDVFEVEAGEDGRIVLRGNNGVSVAVAFHWYLNNVARVRYGWEAAGPLVIPGRLPLPAEKIRRTCAAKERFFMNYCTYGYTMPWWRWERWERFVDWMAMNGINRPLAQAGLEAVWLRVWKSYGLKQQDIQAFFSSPAHLPWHRMGNLDGWSGPLPMSYIDGQMELQKKILARCRGLGMKPILSGFAGHVPRALQTVKPEIELSETEWSGFKTCFLDVNDPLFRDIQLRFIKEQAALYGTDHLYAADPFNEMDPPSWEPAYLGSVAKVICDGMIEADPEAVWYQMSWTFTWGKWKDPRRVAAMADAVPKGRLVFLDYVCEDNELYKRLNGFNGAPFIWCYLGNFGGNTHLAAPMKKVNARIGSALEVENCIGVGSTLEGININPIIFEFVLDRPWCGAGEFDLDAWVERYAVSRCGREDPAVIRAWKLLLHNVFLDSQSTIWGHGTTLQCFPHLRKDAKGIWPGPKVRYAHTDLVAALEEMLKADPACRRADGYQFDVVNLTRQALGNYEAILHRRMVNALETKDLPAFRKAAHRMLEIGEDVEDLVGTRHEFLLGTWISDARSWGKSPEEQAYYEMCSRQILSTWHEPGCSITDYASRQWNGLFGSYYLPRWRECVRRAEKALAEGEPFDHDGLTEWRIKFEGEWVKKSGERFATKAQGDPFTVAHRLFEKYRDELTRTPVVRLLSAEWHHFDCPCSPTRWHYDASAEIREPGKYRLSFEGGDGWRPTRIFRAAVVQDGKELFVKENPGVLHRGNRELACTLEPDKLEPGKPVTLVIEIDVGSPGRFVIEKDRP